MARRKRKVTKPKLSKKKTARKKAVSFSAKKRRGRDMFDIQLKRGYKSVDDFKKIISDKIKTNFKKGLPDDQLKITVYAQKGNSKKNKASLSFIYNLTQKKGLKKVSGDDQMKKLLKKVFKRVFTDKQTGSWKRIKPIRNYISKIVIDFETND